MTAHNRSKLDRLPDDPAYWEALAQRIDARVDARGDFVGWLSERAGFLALVLTTATTLLLTAVALAPVPRGASPSIAAWAAAVSPPDPLGRSFGAASPPNLDRILIASGAMAPREP